MALGPFYFDVNGDFQGNQIMNVVLHSAAGSAHVTIEGEVGFNSTSKKVLYHNGTTVLELASLTGTETLTNKTLTSPVIETGVSGTGLVVSTGGPGTGQKGIRAIGSAVDTLIPTEKAVREAMDSVIAAGNAMVFMGGLACAADPNYPAANCGDTYTVTSAGHVGGASGIVVEVGDMLTCTTDGTASGTQVAVGANWVIVQSNIDIVPVAKGGLGVNLSSTLTAGDILYATSSTAFARLAKGTDGQYLKLASGVPSWATIPTWTPSALTSSSDTNVTITLGGTPATALLQAASITMGWNGQLPVGRGGTGLATITAGGVMYGNGTAAVVPTAAATKQGQVLVSAVTTFVPSWSAYNLPTAALVIGDLWVANSTTSMQAIAAVAVNKVLVSKGVGVIPAWESLAATHIPANFSRVYVAAYENAGAATNTVSVAAATHGFTATAPMFAWLIREDGAVWRPVIADISVNKTTGEVICNTSANQKGKLFIFGANA